MSKIFVTGCNGFVGRAVCRTMIAAGHEVRGGWLMGDEIPGVEMFNIGDLTASDLEADWERGLLGGDVVAHLAAKVHEMKATPEAMAEFRRVNTEGTKRVAERAAAAGVKRLVFISTIKVNGEGTDGRGPYTEDDEPRPEGPYAISKWEAEQALAEFNRKSGLEIAVLRPTMVYGPNAPGNFGRLIRLVQRGLPLPLGSVRNSRSFSFVDNLASAILAACVRPAAAGQKFLISDGQDVSTPELIRRMGAALGKPARLLPAPVALMNLAGRLTGKSEEVDRLVGSLTVDIGKIRRTLSWAPPFSLDEGLRLSCAPLLRK